MQTLVTGGAGFIGSNIVKHLIEEGHTVRVLDDLSSGYCTNLEPFPQVELIEGDIRDAAIVRRADLPPFTGPFPMRVQSVLG